MQRLTASPRRGSRHDQQESGGEATLADVLRVLEADAFEAGRLTAPLLAAVGVAVPAGLWGHLATLEQRVLEVCPLLGCPARRLQTWPISLHLQDLCRTGVATAVHESMKGPPDKTLSKIHLCCVHTLHSRKATYRFNPLAPEVQEHLGSH